MRMDRESPPLQIPIVLRASVLVSIVKIKFSCHVIKLTIHFNSGIYE
jgi:hypothetical protein